MISLSALWLPILLSAVFVFIISSLLHMVFTYHNSDFKKLDNEKEIMDALAPLNIPPGEYVFPYAKDNKERSAPEFIEKAEKGPVGILNVFPNGIGNMTSSLVLWFIFSLVISVFSGYIASAALSSEAHYLQVFRFVGSSAFMGYSLALMQNTIWFKRPWASTLKSMFDGFIYALITAGTFGWLWP